MLENGNSDFSGRFVFSKRKLARKCAVREIFPGSREIFKSENNNCSLSVFRARTLVHATKIKTTRVNGWFALRLKAFVTDQPLKGL
jgi:hypothetical protein